MKKLFFITLISFLFLGCVSSSELWGEKQGNFFVKNDEVRNATVITHENFYKHAVNMGLNYEAIIINDNFCIGTYLKKNSWFFLRKVVFMNDDGLRLVMDLENENRRVLKGGVISESYCNNLSDKKVEQLKLILEGNNPCIAYIGDKHDVPKTQIKGDILTAYFETIDKYYDLNK